MLYSKSREEMLQIAKDLGVRIKFDSENPGVTNVETGVTKDLWSYFEEYGFHMNYTLENLEVERVEPRKNGDFSRQFEDCFWNECA